MSGVDLESLVREVTRKLLPLPAMGNSANRLQQLFDVGREDLSLAKLAEAHWDAVAILAEAGRHAAPEILYAVWASEIPGKAVQLKKNAQNWTLSGTKMFCSGASLVDRALLTVNAPEPMLIDLDLRNCGPNTIEITAEPWCTLAFNHTNTSTITFNDVSISQTDCIGEPEWYLQRAGFWQGALGPAACWGGGAAGLVDFAFRSQRNDPHTMAHLAAMEANIWAIQSLLQKAGDEIDAHPKNAAKAQVLALRVRHLIEQHCTDTLRRFARAYGPFPLACDAQTSRRYQELDLFLRQSHAERDLESLGIQLHQTHQTSLYKNSGNGRLAVTANRGYVS